jgi:D-alanyl-D-alanine carboxypeptidase
VSASVILRDGSQWSGVAGQNRIGEFLRPEQLISIASITKTMTGALILQLADESRLSLDDPVSKWLDPRPHVDPAITLRQLMNHTNGLDNYTTTAAFNATIGADLSRVFTANDLLDFVGPARFQPGARTQYTNTSFLLLGQVAEKVTGHSIVALYHERLWDPLQLGEVFLPGYETPPMPAAHALVSSGGVVNPIEQMSFLSAGNSAFGLLASARDVARWGHALFTGNVVSAKSQTEMRMLVSAAGNIPGETGAGLGIRGYGYLGRSQIGHSGGSWFGSSLLLHDPAVGVTVVVAMNQGQGADHFVLAPSLLEVAARP